MSVFLNGKKASRLFIDGKDIKKAYYNGELIFQKKYIPSNEPFIRFYLNDGSIYDITDPNDIPTLCSRDPYSYEYDEETGKFYYPMQNGDKLYFDSLKDCQIFNRPGFPKTFRYFLHVFWYDRTYTFNMTHDFVVPDDVTDFDWSVPSANININLNNVNVLGYIGDPYYSLINNLTIDLTDHDITSDQEPVIYCSNIHIIKGENKNNIIDFSNSNIICDNIILDNDIAVENQVNSITIRQLRPRHDKYDGVTQYSIVIPSFDLEILKDNTDNYHFDYKFILSCNNLVLRETCFINALEYELTITGHMNIVPGCFCSIFISETDIVREYDELAETGHYDHYYDFEEYDFSNHTVTRDPIFNLYSNTVTIDEIPNYFEHQVHIHMEVLTPTVWITYYGYNGYIRRFNIMPIE